MNKENQNVDEYIEKCKKELPEDILKFLDLREIELVKESFIEKELKEYFSALLYKGGRAHDTS